LFNLDESKRTEKKVELALSQTFSGLDESSPTGKRRKEEREAKEVR
jgi:hypothetical protein